MIFLIAGLGLSAVLSIAAVISHNGLVRRWNRVRHGWHEIDVQLCRRHDLVPQLVAAAQGYLAHEQATVLALAQVQPPAGGGPAEPGARMQAENALAHRLRLFAVSWEGTQTLPSSGQMRRLQEDLISTENRIGFARQHYNDEVMLYNTARDSFPRNLLAALTRLPRAQLLELDLSSNRSL